MNIYILRIVYEPREVVLSLFVWFFRSSCGVVMMVMEGGRYRTRIRSSMSSSNGVNTRNTKTPNYNLTLMDGWMDGAELFSIRLIAQEIKINDLILLLTKKMRNCVTNEIVKPQTVAATTTNNQT